MKLVVALHGNPGSPADCDPLRDLLELGPGVEFLAPPRPAEGCAVDVLVRSLAGQVRQKPPERLALIGFSWGAYLACRLCADEAIRPDVMVLLNPFLVDASPLPDWMRVALATPVLRAWLLRLASGRREAFVDKMFLPVRPAPELRSAMAQRLRGPEVWEGALRYKAEQGLAPLASVPRAACGSMVVIRGEADAIADWGAQRGALAGFESSPGAEVHVVPGAGHSLLWTHGEEVGRILREALKEVSR